MSVCPSVHCTLVLHQNNARITITSLYILNNQVHLEIQQAVTRNDRGHQGEWASGIGTYWRFSTFKLPYHSETLLLITNSKSHTRCRLVPKSMTLDDLERLLFTLLHYVLVLWSSGAHGTHHTKIWMKKIHQYYQQQTCSYSSFRLYNKYVWWWK